MVIFFEQIYTIVIIPTNKIKLRVILFTPDIFLFTPKFS